MKNIGRGSIKHLIALIITAALFGVVLYPVFDFVHDEFITNSEFVYSVNKHIVQPIIFACVFGVTYWAVDKRKK